DEGIELNPSLHCSCSLDHKVHGIFCVDALRSTSNSVRLQMQETEVKIISEVRKDFFIWTIGN
ncbi:hypothetical protein Droror1_Dr00024020, partial [Drosera rotundifolia]